MSRRIVALLWVAFLVLPAVAQAATWKIDPNHSSTSFKIRHLFSKVQGNFTQVSGSIEYDPANPTASKVETEIASSSISTNQEKRDNHLRSPDFFDVANFPTLSFKSTKVEAVKEGNLKVTGDLTMHGVTKPVILDVEVLGTGSHPSIEGGQVAGFTARTTINREDFGLKWNKVLDQGGTLLGNDVDVLIEVEAVNAPPKPDTPQKSG